MPRWTVGLIRVAAFLALLASTGCGTINGWSKTHPADVSRLFLGTRVDASGTAGEVPDFLKPAQWVLSLPSADPEKPAVANCWFCMDVPFSVAADLLMLP